jgi:predicted nucleotidyltransferase
MVCPWQERLDLEELVEWCRRSAVKKLWVFGSVLGEWGADSDIDLLVEFQTAVPGATKEPWNGCFEPT